MHRLQASDVTIAGVLVHPNDRLVDVARALGLEVLPLPTELCASRRRISEALKSRRFRPQMDDWLRQFQALAPDFAIVFYGWWVPPELYDAPREPMINFHPAPLPRNRGYDPETAAVLRDDRSTHGTYHLIDSGFDTGEILWQTNTVSLTPSETPLSILGKVTERGLEELPRLLEARQAGRLAPRPQPDNQVDNVDPVHLAMHSIIDWRTDDHTMIERRHRAFNGKPSRIRLRARIGQAMCCIRRIATREGNFTGEVGAVIGQYPDSIASAARDSPFRGATLVRTRQGVAACVIDHNCLATGADCLVKAYCSMANSKVLPPGPIPDVLSDERLERCLR